MACWLKQSTAVDVLLGPFLDSADGNTIEGALTITQPDIRLSKNGGAFAQKSAAQTLTHGENGWYPANLSTTDTNTLGVLVVAVHESGALPVWREFLVIPANIYDSFFSGDFLQVDVTQWLGSNPTGLSSGKVQSVITSTTPSAIDSSSFAAGSITAASIAADAITAGKIADGAIDAATFAAGAINAAATNADFLAEINAEVDTALADYDAPTLAELDTRTDAIEADTQDIQSRLPAALVSGRIKAIVEAFATGVIDPAAMAASMDSYTTRSWLGRQGSTADKYIVQWFKNGQLITSGITVPLIRVFEDDGTDLIAETAMTEIGSEQCFKFIESTNKLAAGEVYMMAVKATIDGSVRLDRQPVMRDSA